MNLDDSDFVVNRGVLTFFDRSGRIMWSGQPSGAPVSQAIPARSGGGAIVLLDYMFTSHSPFNNIVRLDMSGHTVWTAALPEGGGADSYVAVREEGGLLLANSWSGYQVQLSWLTGTIVAQVFTK